MGRRAANAPDRRSGYPGRPGPGRQAGTSSRAGYDHYGGYAQSGGHPQSGYPGAGYPSGGAGTDTFGGLVDGGRRGGGSRGPGRGGGSGGGPGGYGRPPGRSRGPSRKRFIDFPRYGRTGWRRWVPSWRLVLSLAGAGVLTLVAAFVAAYMMTSLPTRDPLATAQASSVYFADGKVLASYTGPNRRSVPLAQVPEYFQYAVLAGEDRTFYSNSGVSLRGTTRALVSNLRGENLQGGSTITQQYVKNYFDLRDRTLKRKAKEFFLALKINRETPKPKILETYLNTIYLGRNTYGVQSAAKAYFNKDVSKLTVSESAYLAGIINGPEFYDPFDVKKFPDAVSEGQRRWNYVLDGMVAEGWLNPQERAEQKFPKILPPPKEASSRAGQVGYLMDMVSRELERELGLKPEDLATKGYKITTTIDPKMLADAVKAAAEVPELTAAQQKKGQLHTALASIDPTSGAIRSIYGGKDYLARQQNAATQDIAQAGSTFKVFTLIAALQYGPDSGDPLSLRSRFNGRSPQEVQNVPIRNFGPRKGEQFGNIDLVKATEHSVNTVYARLNEAVGPANTIKAARAAGIPEDVKIDSAIGNVLGFASPHPIDMASAYATIASGGVRHKPYIVQSVTAVGDGKTLWKASPKGRRVFDEDVMRDVTYALQEVVKSGTGVKARELNRPAAGKTGTSSDNLSAWFVGFTKELSTSVAFYRTDNTESQGPVPLVDILGIDQVTGGSFPVRMWTDFMAAALDGKPIQDFEGPVFGGEPFNGSEGEDPRPDPTWTGPSRTPTWTPTRTPTGTRTRTKSPTWTPTETPTWTPTGPTDLPPPPPPLNP